MADTIIEIIDFTQEVVQTKDEALRKGFFCGEGALYDALAGDKSDYELLTDKTLKCYG